MSTARTRQPRGASSRARRCLNAFIAGVLVLASAGYGFARDQSPATASADTTGPVLRGLSLSPATIDTSNGSANVVATAHITDDIAGLSSGGAIAISQIELRGPGGSQFARGYFSQAQRFSGSALDGNYRTTIVVAHFAESGTWNATVLLNDAAGNATAYTPAQLQGAAMSASVQQTGAGDHLAPNVAGLAVSPTTIDTSLTTATITVSTHLVDDISGTSNGTTASASQVVLVGPTGTHHVSINLSQRVSGSSLDGVYAGQATVPRYSEQGTWTVASLTVFDNAGNSRSFGPVDLVGTAFITTVQQTGVGDINAPKVVAFAIAPSIVDTSMTAAFVTLRARITDNLSGAAAGIIDSPSQVTFRSPSGAQVVVAAFGNAQLQSGSANDGWYVFQAKLSQASEQGTWTIQNARLVDSAHNSATLDPTEWSQLNFPAAFDVRSDGTASAPSSVVASATAAPTIASVSWLPPAIVGSSPISQYTVTATPGGATSTANGNANSATITGLSVGSTYTFSVHATNGAGPGAESANSNFFIAGGAPDLLAPAVVDLSIAPIAVETISGPTGMTLDLSITDDVSGLLDGTNAAALSRVQFNRPDGTPGPTVSFAAHQMVTGTAAVGTYEAWLPLAQNSMIGTWPIASLTLIDGVGHTTSLTNAQLSALGAATGFVITDAGTPTAPLAVSATAGDATADVSWVAPVSDGSSPITSFTVTATPGNTAMTVPAGSTAATFVGLHNGTSYTFAVRATNAIGTGIASARSNAVIPGNVDQTAPQILGFSLTPLTLSTSALAQNVTIDAHIVDAGSGLADTSPYSTAAFVGPNGVDAGMVAFTPTARTVGTALDGSYSVGLTVPPNAPPGVYPIKAIVLIDRAGNQITMTPSQLAAAGFPASFAIVGGTPPDPPTSVSATAGDTTAAVSWIAPLNQGTSAPVTGYTVTSNPGGITTTVSGSVSNAVVAGLTNGTLYTFTVTAMNSVLTSVPSASSNGVTPGSPDQTAPTLGSLVVAPNLVDPANSPVNIVVSLHIDDVGSGVADATPSTVVVSAPSGKGASFAVTSAQRIAGDANAGDYTVTIPITAADESGLWSITTVMLRDAAGNAVTLDQPALAVFPARSFTVASSRLPGSPTGVALQRTTGGYNLVWTAPVDPGSSAVLKYVVVATLDGATTDVDVATPTLFVSSASLARNATVSYRVLAVSAVGASSLSVLSNSIINTQSYAPSRTCVTVARGRSGTPSASVGRLRGCAHIGWLPRRRRPHSSHH